MWFNTHMHGSACKQVHCLLAQILREMQPARLSALQTPGLQAMVVRAASRLSAAQSSHAKLAQLA